jgi:hypothetical protein
MGAVVKQILSRASLEIPIVHRELTSVIVGFFRLNRSGTVDQFPRLGASIDLAQQRAHS